MVKPINHIIKAYKTRRGASLQVMLLIHHLRCRVALTVINCIDNYKKISWKVKLESCKKFGLQYFYLVDSYRKYNTSVVTLVINKEKTINITSCKISNHAAFFIETGAHYWQIQRNIKLNQQRREANVHLGWKLNRSILGKYRYTSLELVVRSAALTAGHIANFRTCNPVRVTNSENNEEHCHNIWQRQTTVDS